MVYNLDLNGSIRWRMDLAKEGMNLMESQGLVDEDGILYVIVCNSSRAIVFDDLWQWDSFEPSQLWAITTNGTILWKITPMAEYGYEISYTRLIGRSSTGQVLMLISPGEQVSEQNYTEWSANGSKAISWIDGRLCAIDHNGDIATLCELPSSIGYIVLSDDQMYVFYPAAIELLSLNGTVMGHYHDEEGKQINYAAVRENGTIYYFSGSIENGDIELIVSDGLPHEVSSDYLGKIPGSDDVTYVTVIMVIMLISASAIYVLRSRGHEER